MKKPQDRTGIQSSGNGTVAGDTLPADAARNHSVTGMGYERGSLSHSTSGSSRTVAA